MVMDNVIDRIVAHLNRIVRLSDVWRTIAWRSRERMGARLIDCVIHVGDKLVCRNRI